MRKWLASLFLCFFLISSLSAKVYDCFLFFNELEVLKLHLEELYDHVEKFVLVESCQTFSGNKKPFYFEENKQDFSKYLDKIIHIKLKKWQETDNPWERESYQRSELIQGLKDLETTDFVIVSDVDEIVKPKEIPKILARLSRKKAVLGCKCDFYRFYLNRKDPSPLIGPAVASFATVKRLGTDGIRKQRYKHLYPSGGWHFSNMGGFSSYQEKIHSFSHFRDFDLSTQTIPNIHQAIQNFERVEIDSSFPEYIQKNQNYYIEKGFIDTGNNYYR